MTTAPKSVGLSTFLSEHLQRAEPDVLRTLVKSFIEAESDQPGNAVTQPRMWS